MSYCLGCDAPCSTSVCQECGEKEKVRYLAGDKRLSSDYDIDPNSGWEYDTEEESNTLKEMGFI